MERHMKILSWKIKDNDKDGTKEMSVTATYANKIGEMSEGIIARQIADKLADMWVEKYGADLIDKLAPDVIEKDLRDTIAKRVLGETKYAKY